MPISISTILPLFVLNAAMEDLTRIMSKPFELVALS